MDPADKRGQNEPKPRDPTEPINEAEVERTLEKLESITSTLVREVGTTAARSQVQQAAAPGSAPAQAAPATPPPQAPSAPDAAQGRSQAGGPTPSQGHAAAAPPAAAAPAAKPAIAAAPAPATPASPAAQQGGPARAAPNDSAPAGENARATVPAQVPAPNAVSGQASARTELQAADRRADSGRMVDGEVEQEISQAIQQLGAGKPPAPGMPAGPPGQKPAAPAAQPAPASVWVRAGKVLDQVLLPLAFVVTVVDLPFRRMPGALRQLLGYVAVGTALMTVALWYYIFMLHGR